MAPSRIDAEGMAHPVTNYPERIPLDELRERIGPIQRALGLEQSGEEQ